MPGILSFSGPHADNRAEGGRDPDAIVVERNPRNREAYHLLPNQGAINDQLAIFPGNLLRGFVFIYWTLLLCKLIYWYQWIPNTVTVDGMQAYAMIVSLFVSGCTYICSSWKNPVLPLPFLIVAIVESAFPVLHLAYQSAYLALTKYELCPGISVNELILHGAFSLFQTVCIAFFTLLVTQFIDKRKYEDTLMYLNAKFNSENLVQVCGAVHALISLLTISLPESSFLSWFLPFFQCLMYAVLAIVIVLRSSTLLIPFVIINMCQLYWCAVAGAFAFDCMMFGSECNVVMGVRVIFTIMGLVFYSCAIVTILELQATFWKEKQLRTRNQGNPGVNCQDEEVQPSRPEDDPPSYPAEDDPPSYRAVAVVVEESNC